MSGGQQVNLMQLPLPQLDALKNQVEQELDFFSNSINQLRIGQTKLAEAAESVAKIRQDSQGSEMLVPLTSSLYVPGKLNDVNKVLIEIGTGYYVEKTVKDAEDYYKRKIEFITKQVEKLTVLLQEKVKLKQTVVEVMQIKIQAQIAAQQQQTGTVKS
ncbi:prefoldin subunit 5-like [Glandiceps talaboti]